MAYTDIDKPSDYFRVKTYEGSYTDNNTVTWDETGTNFGSNLLLWLKNRDLAQEHWLTDSVRGATKFLESNSGNAEVDAGGNFAYTTNGFVLDNNARTNRESMVGWGWNTSGTASSNTDGSITSTVSANTVSGFSIVSYTGTANSSDTVGHGLGTIPKMIIIKRRDDAGGTNWCVYHVSNNNTKVMFLESTSTGISNVRYWNNTTPTSSVFSIGNDDSLNASGGTFIAYCFAEKKGFSKFGSYTGNGNADGTFVYTGFKPAMVIFKNTLTANRQWQLLDNKRSSSGGNNVINITISPNNLNDESWWGTNNYADFLSNGFKLRASYDGVNESSGNYIYMAFAENPFVTSTGIPTTAR